MTVLPLKRSVRETGPQTPGFADLALPLLPSLYNVAFWLSRNRRGCGGPGAGDISESPSRISPHSRPGSNFKAWIFRILRNTYLTSRTGLAAMRTVALEDELDDA